MMKPNNDRDLAGYGASPPHPAWPQEARIAINFVLNFEEGGEQSPVLGDQFAESYGGEFLPNPKPAGMRDFSMESIFEYGSRAGFWRIAKLFDAQNIPLTIFATGKALQLNPDVADYLKSGMHEVAGHGWRWIDYAEIPIEVEREHIKKTISIIESQTGSRPIGWYTGRRSENTRDLLCEIGGFKYDSESYADDLPYYVEVNQNQHLVIPYTLDTNDFRFVTNPGFSSSEDFFIHLRDSFDFLYEEGHSSPKMMNIGLHCRITGRPARAQALSKFLEHIAQYEAVWICRRDEIALHWLDIHPPA